jgi:hypothetical protein
MIRARFGVALAISGLVLAGAAVQADVKSQEKTQVKFEGALGRMMNLFGGKAAKEGLVQTVAVKGDRKATLTEDSGTIVDLAEEKVYDLNFKNKTYKVTTFAELRKQLQEQRAKAEEEARKAQAREEKTQKDPDQKELEVDFTLKETGQKREIRGYACREVLATVAVREKGRKIEQSGGVEMVVSMWLAPTVSAMKESAEFDMRYARKLAEGVVPSAVDLTQMLAMYPGLQKAMERMQKEKVNMDGTAIQTITTFQSVMSPEQAQAKENEKSSSPGGGLGGLMGRFGRKKADDTKPKDGAPAAAPAGPGRSTIMTASSRSSVKAAGRPAAASPLRTPRGAGLEAPRPRSSPLVAPALISQLSDSGTCRSWPHRRGSRPRT